MKPSLCMIFWMDLCLTLSQGYRILGVFPYRAKSHFVMFEALMKGLAEKGHRVDVISPFPLTKPVVNYNDLIVIKTRGNTLNNVSYDVASNIFTVHAISTISGNPVCEYLRHPEIQKLIRNPPKDPPYDVVLIEVIPLTFNCISFIRRFVPRPFSETTITTTTASLVPFYATFRMFCISARGIYNDVCA